MEESRANILVVDDYSMNLKIAEFALKNTFNVFTAESGSAALDILSNSPIDLILLDILMPEMDGFETYEQIRQLPSYASTPVCFLTGDTDADVLARINELKLPYLGKPFDPSKLNEMVSSLLK